MTKDIDYTLSSIYKKNRLMSSYIKIFYSMSVFVSMILIIILLGSCEEEITPDVSLQDIEIVVDGHIEMGDGALPPYVILSHSLPYFGDLSQEELLKSNIKEAQVTVIYDQKTYPLDKICLNDLPDVLKAQLAKQLGIDPDQLDGVDYCFFSDLKGQIPITEGGKYDLTVETEGKTLTSTTTIPIGVPLDSLYYKEVPGAAPKYREMFVRLNPPEGEHFYRYFIGLGNSNPGQTSVRSTFSDKLFSNEALDFKLLKPVTRTSERRDPTVFFYQLGDTVTLKWSIIDKSHYRFWRTLEYNRQNQGPFSSYTRVETNIEGGIGIWGGYRSFVYRTIVQ